ncbi:hypothetical protein K1719_001549 [Acacia pycnantha]|nr:hypothetical protein K1719_001549 [Acacia pycnantha]
MVHYYEGLTGSPATVHLLKRAWAKYSLDYGLINSLSDFGIYFDLVLNMLVGYDSCWNAAEMQILDAKKFIQNMKRRVIVNFHLLGAIFSNFSKNNASSSNGHEQRIANLEKEMEETKAGEELGIIGDESGESMDSGAHNNHEGYSWQPHPDILGYLEEIYQNAGTITNTQREHYLAFLDMVPGIYFGICYHTVHASDKE